MIIDISTIVGIVLYMAYYILWPNRGRTVVDSD